MNIFKIKTDYTSFTDESLILEFRQGKNPAFEELYRRYNKKINYYFRKMLNNDIHRAQDFTHDVFLKLINKPTLFDVNRKFSTWIYSICYYKCIDEYKKNDKIKMIDEEIDFDEFQDDDNFDKKFDREELMTLINEQINLLPATHKSILILRFQEQLSLNEIAEISDIPLGTVKSRLFNALNKISVKVKSQINFMDN